MPYGYPAMRKFRSIVSSIEGIHPLRESAYRFTPGRTSHLERARLQPAQPQPKPHRVNQRRPRCDCGKLAITVLKVRVGSDPQYTIRLPLCSACLALEQSFRSGG
jgi:hypothetical protein